MSRHFRVVYADKAQGRTFRVCTYVHATDADAVRDMLHGVKIVSVKEVK